MEIGSFIELQFPTGHEYYNQKIGIARLNTGRAAIQHALRITGCNIIWLPYYQCDSVRDFLLRNGVTIKYYHIDECFNPTDLEAKDTEAVLLVNYFGVMSSKRMAMLATKYKNVIIDNCQAFFSKPVDACLNVYSCRKFIGVPDGAYVLGLGAEKYEYPQGYSSDTSSFLLERIEYGCEGKAYSDRQINEHRLDMEACKQMSKLTRAILDGTDYDKIIQIRRENFEIASCFFDKYNRLNASMYYDADTVPMVYPLVIEDENLLSQLQAAKHFQGHWWSYICRELSEKTFEHWISRYIIPITIDQRYGRKDLEYIRSVVNT